MINVLLPNNMAPHVVLAIAQRAKGNVLPTTLNVGRGEEGLCLAKWNKRGHGSFKGPRPIGLRGEGTGASPEPGVDRKWFS